MLRRRSRSAQAESRPERAAGRKPRRGRRRVSKLFALATIGTAATLALSERARGKALDALFGSEEEFTYTPPSSADGDGSAS